MYSAQQCERANIDMTYQILNFFLISYTCRWTNYNFTGPIAFINLFVDFFGGNEALVSVSTGDDNGGA